MNRRLVHCSRPRWGSPSSSASRGVRPPRSGSTSCSWSSTTSAAVWLLRRPRRQVAERRPPRGARGPIRAGVLPVPGLQREPDLVPDGAAARHDGRPRERHPLPRQAAGGGHAPPALPPERVLHGEPRQDLPPRPRRGRQADVLPRPEVMGGELHLPGDPDRPARRGTEPHRRQDRGGPLARRRGGRRDQPDGQLAAEALRLLERTATVRSSWPSASTSPTTRSTHLRPTSTSTRPTRSGSPGAREPVAGEPAVDPVNSPLAALGEAEQRE